MHWDKSKDEKRDIVSRQTSKKKSTAKWCKGKVGVEHVSEIVVNHNYSYVKDQRCSWFPQWFSWRSRRDGEAPKDYRYRCLHSLKCINCGKYTKYFLPQEQCPTLTPKPV